MLALVGDEAVAEVIAEIVEDVDDAEVEEFEESKT